MTTQQESSNRGLLPSEEVIHGVALAVMCILPRMVRHLPAS